MLPLPVPFELEIRLGLGLQLGLGDDGLNSWIGLMISAVRAVKTRRYRSDSDIWILKSSQILITFQCRILGLASCWIPAGITLKHSNSDLSCSWIFGRRNRPGTFSDSFETLPTEVRPNFIVSIIHYELTDSLKLRL